MLLFLNLTREWLQQLLQLYTVLWKPGLHYTGDHNMCVILANQLFGEINNVIPKSDLYAAMLSAFLRQNLDVDLCGSIRRNGRRWPCREYLLIGFRTLINTYKCWQWGISEAMSLGLSSGQDAYRTCMFIRLIKYVLEIICSPLCEENLLTKPETALRVLH